LLQKIIARYIPRLFNIGIDPPNQYNNTTLQAAYDLQIKDLIEKRSKLI